MGKSMSSLDGLDEQLTARVALTKQLATCTTQLREAWGNVQTPGDKREEESEEEVTARRATWQKYIKKGLELLEGASKLTEKGFEWRAALVDGSDPEAWSEEREEEFEDEYANYKVAYLTLLKWAKQQAAFSTVAEQGAAATEDEAAGCAEDGDVARVVTHLTAVEHSLDFQMRLVGAMKQMGASTDYTEANFSYGSTPFVSWRRVFDSPRLDAAMKEAAAGRGKYVVFGSSIGWLAFYGACSYRTSTVGVEIMQYLVDVASEARATLSVDGVEFIHEDMLQYNLTDARVVMLTSQCWDEQLIAAVHAKLAKEMEPGALVVDYRAMGETHSDAFELVDTVATKVSWNPQQLFFVYSRREQ